MSEWYKPPKKTEEYKDLYSLEELQKILCERGRVFDSIEFHEKRMRIRFYMYNNITEEFRSAFVMCKIKWDWNGDWFVADLYKLSKFVNMFYNRIRILPGDPLHRKLMDIV